MGLVALQHVGSSQTRARTRVPCIGKEILNHCTTREVCIYSFYLGTFAQRTQPCHFISGSFLLAADMDSIVRIYHNLFICSCVDGHLDCFQFGAIMNKVAMKVLSAFVDIMFSFIFGK